MHLGSGDLAWWSPDPRGILPLDGLRITTSLRKSMKRFTITFDTAFVDVMRACGDPDRDGAWITEDFVEAYRALHDMGWAHSVDVWDDDDELVGGLYGVEIGGLFAGESMFHRERDASKAALVALVNQLSTAGGPRLLDVQWRTDHLASLGVIEVSRQDYLSALGQALTLPPSFTERGPHE
jgi:leucyl/phenylalanyl-tRNA--protein transferase